ncbi:MAG: DUF1800 family protein [Acidobacteriota bacterium]
MQREGTEPGAATRGSATFDRRDLLAGSSFLASLFGSSRSFAQRPTARSARQDAARLLTQGAFGGTALEIDEVVRLGAEGWLDAQIRLRHEPFVDEVETLLRRYPNEELPFDWAWWRRAMTGRDVLRQRVAFVLSQIFVISRRSDTLFDAYLGVASYYDLLSVGAFGNFHDLLRGVALHGCMGDYLSHLNNRRSDPSQNRFPDENFAREVMQLFTIGLFELNPDGTRQLDSQGQPIPTYDNRQITEMAKVFTGLTLAPEEEDEPIEFGGVHPELMDRPMVMFEPEHEPGPKALLNGFVVPAGQPGMQDIEDAIEHLFQHPNVGPFIGSHLIRFLVTSNPSPAYVERVASAFDNNGRGVRGDMAAVVKAVLLDDEARDPARLEDPRFGKVREPLVRWVQLGRAFPATSPNGGFRHYGGDAADAESVSELANFAQYPMFSPSVFNFFSPSHQPVGPIADADLVAPEMEIIHSSTTISTINLFHRAILEDEYLFSHTGELTDPDPVFLDFGRERAIAEQSLTALVDHLDLVLAHGSLSSHTRRVVLEAVTELDEVEDQVRLAVYLITCAPDYVVQR